MLQILFLVLTIFELQANGELAEAPPFWQAKPKLLERVHSREILVSVTSSKNSFASARKNTLHAGGGGQVAAPCASVFVSAQRLGDLAKTSSYVKRSDYDSATHILDLDLEAFGHRSSMRVEVLVQAGDTPQSLDYRLLSGPMEGFKGKIQFFPDSKLKCDIGFRGEYRYDQFPIPKIFLEFGMEVVLKSIAFRSRGYLEDRFKEEAARHE